MPGRNGGSQTFRPGLFKWLAFLHTVRTERFRDILDLSGLLALFARAAAYCSEASLPSPLAHDRPVQACKAVTG